MNNETDCKEQLKLIKRLNKFTTTKDGELVTRSGYTPTHKVRLGSQLITLKAFVYFVLSGVLPDCRISISSTTSGSIDPRYFIFY